MNLSILTTMKRAALLLSVSAAAIAMVATPTWSQTTADAQPYLGVFPALLEGLRATPGCLGVETAKTGSGKQVVFGWFENKAAALTWYNSEVHQRLMRRFRPDAQNHTPLEGVPDDSGPILAIASVTLSETITDRNQLPFSQIAIELYRPINGGISFGGRCAPTALKVPGLREGFVATPKP